MIGDDKLSTTIRPWGSFKVINSPDADIGILGIPFDGAVSWRKGAAQAPAHIRELSYLIDPVTEDRFSIQQTRLCDYGDVEVGENWEQLSNNCQIGARKALQHRFALFLGGDHSVTIPLLTTFSQMVPGPVGVIHFDAHPDLCDIYDGRKWSHACTQRRVLELPNVEPHHLVFVGVRTLLSEELEFYKTYPELGWHSARDCHQQGIENIAERVVKQLKDASAVYFTLDIDGLDPAFAPGTGTPQAGGLSTRELLEFVRIVFAELPIRALDLVEISPPLDVSDITSFAALKVLNEVFGWVQQGHMGEL